MGTLSVHLRPTPHYQSLSLSARDHSQHSDRRATDADRHPAPSLVSTRARHCGLGAPRGRRREEMARLVDDDPRGDQLQQQRRRGRANRRTAGLATQCDGDAQGPDRVRDLLQRGRSRPAAPR